jgi:hypothetical protein
MALTQLDTRLKRLESGRRIWQPEHMTVAELDAELSNSPVDPAFMAALTHWLEGLSDVELHRWAYGPGVPFGLPHEAGRTGEIGGVQ